MHCVAWLSFGLLFGCIHCLTAAVRHVRQARQQTLVRSEVPVHPQKAELGLEALELLVRRRKRALRQQALALLEE